MKVWHGFGSEHSYRLVLVGRFADARDAQVVEETYERLRGIAAEEAGAIDWDDPNPGYSDAMYEKLRAIGAGNLSRTDVEGFAYLETLDRDGDTIRVRTDDAELQGLLKLLFDHGARVEIYSSHHWEEDGRPRGDEQDVELSATALDGQAVRSSATAVDAGPQAAKADDRAAMPAPDAASSSAGDAATSESTDGGSAET